MGNDNEKRKGEDEDRESQGPSKLLISRRKPILATNRNRNYSCNKCRNVFCFFEALERHLCYGDERETCPEKFESRQALGGHLKKRRSNPRVKKGKTESCAGSTSKSATGRKEKSEELEGPRGDNSALVTRNFFPMEPMWANPEPIVLQRVLERSDSWLDFKLAPLGGELNRKRDVEDREAQPKQITASDLSCVFLCKACKDNFLLYLPILIPRASLNFKIGNLTGADLAPTSTSQGFHECRFCLEKVIWRPPVEIVHVLGRSDASLDSKLAPLVGDLNRIRDVEDSEAQSRSITAPDLYCDLLCKACKNELLDSLTRIYAKWTLKTGADQAPISCSGKFPECLLCLEKAKYKASRPRSTSQRFSQSDLSCEEKSVGEEGSKGDNSTLVTRNFFPMEPMWANPEPVEVVPVLERSDSWLDLKLAPLGGDLNRRKD